MSMTSVVEILLRLPAFDLLRCKAVCKAWRSLISSADFVAAHLERAKSDPSRHHLLVRNRCSSDLRGPVAGDPFFLSFACFSSPDLVIVGSANGLICIAGEGDRIPSSPDDIWILNPVTGLSKKLPYSSRFPSANKNKKLPYSSRFPSANKNVKFAFWCDEDGVFKVAKFMSNTSVETTLELWVSDCPCSWTDICTIELQFHLHPRRCHPCDVLIQGIAAYWIIVEERDDDDYDDDDDMGDDDITVVSLNLKTLLVTKFMPLSKGLLGMRNTLFSRAANGYPNSYLFGGSLNGEFVLVAWSSYKRVYGIWTLATTTTGMGACWVKKFSMSFDLYPFEKCLGILNEKLVLTRYKDMEVALCDLVTGRLEMIEMSSKPETVTLDAACGFVGSLVSIDGFGFQWNDLLRIYMGIKWPYSSYHYPIEWPFSSYHYPRKESSKTNLKKKKRSRRWDQVNIKNSPPHFPHCRYNLVDTSQFS